MAPPVAVVVVVALAVVVTAGCPIFRRKHISVSSVPQLPYPSCGTGALPPGEVVAQGHLRSGPDSRERLINERWEIRRRDCLFVTTVRQEWPITTTDIEVVYDANMLPLRAWRRFTVPGARRGDGSPDIRRYEFRTPEVTVTRRDASGARTYEIIRGARPRAVLAAGRGMLTLWLRRARLPVGGRLREWVLDLRNPLEHLREVTLARVPDLYESTMHRTVRVYTVYGREGVFADEGDTVLGDLSGLRPHETLGTPEPPRLPLFGVPDPLHTP